MIQHNDLNPQNLERDQHFASNMSAYTERLNDRQKMDFFVGARLAGKGGRISETESDKAFELQNSFLKPMIMGATGADVMDGELAKQRYQSMLKEQFKAFVKVGKNYEDQFVKLDPDNPDSNDIAAHYARNSKEGVLADAFEFGSFRIGDADSLTYAINQGEEEFSTIVDQWTEEAEKEFKASLSQEDRDRFDIGKDLNKVNPDMITKTPEELGIKEKLDEYKNRNYRSYNMSVDTNYRLAGNFNNAHKYVLDGTDEIVAKKIADQYNALPTDKDKLKFIEDLEVMNAAGNLSEAEIAQKDNCIRDFFNPVTSDGEPDFTTFNSRVNLSHERRIELRNKAAEEFNAYVAEKNLDLSSMSNEDKQREMAKFASTNDSFVREYLHHESFALEHMGQDYIGDEYKENFIENSGYKDMAEADPKERFVGAWVKQYENARNFNATTLDDDADENDLSDTADEMSEAFANSGRLLSEEENRNLRTQSDKMMKGFARNAEKGKSFRDNTAHVNMDMLHNVSESYTQMRDADKLLHLNSKRYDELLSSMKRIHDKYQYYQENNIELTEDDKQQLMADLEDLQEKNETYYNSKVSLKKKSDLDLQREEISKGLRETLNPKPEVVIAGQEAREAEEDALNEELANLDNPDYVDPYQQEVDAELEALLQQEKEDKEREEEELKNDEDLKELQSQIDQDDAEKSEKPDDQEAQEEPEEDTQEKEQNQAEIESEGQEQDDTATEDASKDKEHDDLLDDFEIIEKEDIATDDVSKDKEHDDLLDDFVIVDKEDVEALIDAEKEEKENTAEDIVEEEDENLVEEAEDVNDAQDSSQKNDEEPQNAADETQQTNQAQQQTSQTAPQSTQTQSQQPGQRAPQSTQTQSASASGFQMQRQGSVTLDRQAPVAPSRATALSRVPVSGKMKNIMADYSGKAREILGDLRKLNIDEKEKIRPLIQSLTKLATITGNENLQQMDDLFAEISQNSRNLDVDPFTAEDLEKVNDFRADFRKEVNRSFNSSLNRTNRNENKLSNSKNRYIRIYNELQNIDATGADKETIDRLSDEIDKLSDRDNRDLSSLMESGNRINQIALDYSGTNPDIQRLCMSCVEANNAMTRNLASYRQDEFNERQKEEENQKKANEFFSKNGTIEPVIADDVAMTETQAIPTEPDFTDDVPTTETKADSIEQSEEPEAELANGAAVKESLGIPNDTQKQPNGMEPEATVPNINQQAEQMKNEALDIEEEPEAVQSTVDQPKQNTDEVTKPEENKAEKNPEVQKAEDKKPEEKKGGEKKTEEINAEEKKPEEKKSEEKKAEEKKPEEKKSEEKKAEEKKAEEKKPEAKSSTESKEKKAYNDGPVTAESLQKTEEFQDLQKFLSGLAQKRREEVQKKQPEISGPEKPLIAEIPVQQKKAHKKKQPEKAPVVGEVNKEQASKQNQQSAQKAKKSAQTQTASQKATKVTEPKKVTQTASQKAAQVAPKTVTKTEPKKAAQTQVKATKVTAPKKVTQTASEKAEPKKVEQTQKASQAAPKKPESKKTVTASTAQSATGKAASKKSANPTVTKTVVQDKKATKTTAQITAQSPQKSEKAIAREKKRIAFENQMNAKRRLVDELKANKGKALPVKNSKSGYVSQYKLALQALQGKKDAIEMRKSMLDIIKNSQTDTPEQVQERLAQFDQAIKNTKSTDPKVNRIVQICQRLCNQQKQDCTRASYYLGGEKKLTM